LGLRGRQIDQAVDKATRGYSQGTVAVEDIPIQIPKQEANLKNIMANSATDKAYYAHMNTPEALERQRQQDIISLNREIKMSKDPETTRILQAELDKVNGTYAPPKMSSSDIELASDIFGRVPQRVNTRPEANPDWRVEGTTVPVPKHLLAQRIDDDRRAMKSTSQPASLNTQGGLVPIVQKQPMGVSIPPVANVNVEDGTDNVVPETPDVVADKAVNVLNDDYSQEVLEKAMQTYSEMDPNSTPQEKQSFLTRMFESIYGESGLFREQDIGRFALLAAGGILTGGSIAGSVKYAAMDALQRGDARHQGEAASVAAAGIRREKVAEEDQKNSRELHEQIKLKIPEYLAKNVSPEVRQKALDMGRKPAKTMGELIARDRSIVEFLAANVQHKDPNDKSPFADKPSTGYLNGNPVQYHSVNGKVMISDYKGGFRELTDQDKFLDGGSFNTEYSRAEKQIEDQLRPSLKLAMGKDFNEEDLKSIRSELMYTWSDMGGMDLREFAKVSSGLAEGISKQELKTAPGEAIRKAFYGKAVVAINPSAEKYLRTPEGGKPSVMGLAKFGDAIQSELADYNRTAAKKKIDPIDVGVFSNKLIDDFEKNVPPAIKDEMFSRARAQTDPKDKHFGMSPFMIWVAMGMPTESPKK